MTEPRRPSIRGNVVAMLQVPRPYPGWQAVVTQAEECGFTGKNLQTLHVTVVYFGRDMSRRRGDAARAAVLGAMEEVRQIWEAAKAQSALVAHTPTIPPDVPAFVPLRFPGQIGTYSNPHAASVHVVVESSATLLRFRKMILDRYEKAGFKARMDFGATYEPHLTLAEGPPGTRLRREALVPACKTNSPRVTLKMGEDREVFVF